MVKRMGKKVLYIPELICGIFLLAVSSSFAAGQAKGMEAVPLAPAGEAKTNPAERDSSVEIEALRNEMKEKPADSTALRLGQLLLIKGDNGEALLSFEEALKLNPRSIEAKVGKGIALGRQGEYGKAEQALREALPLNPNPARVHYELGVLCERSGDFAGAVTEYKAGLKRYQEGIK
jgi:Flp pilus assembly protein TadD